MVSTVHGPQSISLKNIERLNFLMETDRVLCDVETKVLYII
jgi:hypothetical protein